MTRQELIRAAAMVIDGSAVAYAEECPLTGGEPKQSGPILLHAYAERALRKAAEIVDLVRGEMELEQ